MIQILPDNIPEEDEEFYVNLTAVTRLPTDTTQSKFMSVLAYFNIEKVL